MSVLIKNKETGEWTDVAGGGGAGEVTKKYVDDQDQSMLTDSKSYTDAKKDEIDDSVQTKMQTLDAVLTKRMEDKDKVIADKVTALETTVGSSTSGLVKAVNDVTSTVGNSNTGLVKAVTALETTVGDSTKGLVKDVASLKTTVGSSTSGLVKTVADLPSYIRNQNVLSDWEALPDKISTDVDVYTFMAAYDGYAVIEGAGIEASSSAVGTASLSVYKGTNVTDTAKIAYAVVNTPVKGSAYSGSTYVNNVPHPCVTIPVKKGEYYTVSVQHLSSNEMPTSNPAKASYVSGKICYYKQRDYTGR